MATETIDKVHEVFKSGKRVFENEDFSLIDKCVCFNSQGKPSPDVAKDMTEKYKVIESIKRQIEQAMETISIKN